MPESVLLSVDPRLVAIANDVFDLMSNTTRVSALGTNWRIVIERYGKPAAVVERDRDRGMLVSFYGDETTAQNTGEEGRDV